jgi:hypothetical protein
MSKFWFFSFILLAFWCGNAAAAQLDPYAVLIAQAEQGDASVDFHALRLAYLKSPMRAKAQFSMVLPGLKQTLESQLSTAGSTIATRDAAVKIGDTALQILAIDYVDLTAQRALRLACKRLGNTACEKRRHFVEFGFLKSIIGTGDGKTCKTAWEAIIPGEEQAVLEMLNVTLVTQARAMDGKHSCDEMHVKSGEGRKLVYYFNVDAILADQAASVTAPVPRQ